MSEYIRPDRFTLLRLTYPNGEMSEMGINAKYDRIDQFKEIGAYILKIVSDTGYSEEVISEESAFNIYRESELPLVPRTFIYESEYKLWLRNQDFDSELDDLC